MVFGRSFSGDRAASTEAVLARAEATNTNGAFGQPGRALPPNTRAPSVLGAQPQTFARGREVAALLLWTVSVFFALALASYAGEPAAPAGQVDTATITGENWVGPVGAVVARAFVALVGLMSWVVPL